MLIRSTFKDYYDPAASLGIDTSIIYHRETRSVELKSNFLIDELPQVFPDGNGAYLLLTDGSGRKRIAALPGPLQGLEGARVWITTKPGARAARSYGVIDRR